MQYICSNSDQQIIKQSLLAEMAHVEHSIHRAEALQLVGSYLAPKVFVDISNTKITIIQQRAKFDFTFALAVGPQKVILLAKIVDSFHKHGLVHGDLCTSNIGVRSGKVLIFDWEASLELKTGGLRTTRYCIHPQDLKAGRISVLTDRYAVTLLALMSRLGISSPTLARKKFHRLILQLLVKHEEIPLYRIVTAVL
mgnify:CR=1 FL=1